jgi:hypothetical protein
LPGHPDLRPAAKVNRILPDNGLMSFQTNRHSVRVQLVEQTGELKRQGGEIVILHRDRPSARHGLLGGKHQVHIPPEPSRAAIGRDTQRRRHHSPEWRPARIPSSDCAT